MVINSRRVSLPFESLENLDDLVSFDTGSNSPKIAHLLGPVIDKGTDPFRVVVQEITGPFIPSGLHVLVCISVVHPLYLCSAEFCAHGIQNPNHPRLDSKMIRVGK